METERRSPLFELAPGDLDRGPSILLVDDEDVVRKSLLRIISESPELKEVQIFQASNAVEALELLRRERIHVVVLDKNLGPDENDPAQNGIRLIPDILSLRPDSQILMFTASGDTQDVVEAMKRGAFGYIPKKSGGEGASAHFDFIRGQILKALNYAEARVRGSRVERTIATPRPLELSGKSQKMRQVYEKLKLVAQSDCPVLLLGETGVGKTTIAKAIHEFRKQLAAQRDRPFCNLNLSALSRDLIERELFGNEKGAYTGANVRKQGYIELAHRGTLFLDEIGDISPDIQVKLLKVLDEKRFCRVGGVVEIESNFKLICATNRNLELLVEKGLFREDLYYRITNFAITVPPIRERLDEIPDLVRALIPKICQETKVAATFEEIPDDFVDYLQSSPPKGNIRGLERALEHLFTFAPRDELGRPHLDRWKSIDELRKRGNRRHLSGPVITYDDLKKSQFDVMDENFPGLEVFQKLVLEKLFEEGEKKFPKSVRMAEAMKVAPSTVSLHRRKVDRRRKPIVNAEQKMAEATSPSEFT